MHAMLRPSIETEFKTCFTDRQSPDSEAANGQPPSASAPIARAPNALAPVAARPIVNCRRFLVCVIENYST
jgi:hypothetical protein